MESSWVHSSSILNDLDAERTNANHNSPDVMSGLTVVTMMDVYFLADVTQLSKVSIGVSIWLLSMSSYHVS